MSICPLGDCWLYGGSDDRYCTRDGSTLVPFDCPNCGEEAIAKSYAFCPRCGHALRDEMRLLLNQWLEPCVLCDQNTVHFKRDGKWICSQCMEEQV